MPDISANESIAHNFTRSPIMQIIKTTPAGTKPEHHNGEGAVSIIGSFDDTAQKDAFIAGIKRKFTGAETTTQHSPSGLPELIISNVTHVGTVTRDALQELAHAGLIETAQAQEAQKALIPLLPPISIGYATRESSRGSR